MKRVNIKVIPIMACELTLETPEFFGSEVTHDLDSFEKRVNLIVANRWNEELADVEDIVYARELFKRD